LSRARAHEPAEQQRPAGDDRRGEEEVVEPAGRIVGPDGDGGATDQHHSTRHQFAPLGIRAHRVRDHEEEEERREQRLDAQVLDGAGGRDPDRRRHHRQAPAHGDRGGQRDEHRAGDQQIAARRLGEQQLDLELDRHRDREQHVGAPDRAGHPRTLSAGGATR
jgi:hypothetical protein